MLIKTSVLIKIPDFGFQTSGFCYPQLAFDEHTPFDSGLVFKSGIYQSIKLEISLANRYFKIEFILAISDHKASNAVICTLFQACSK